MQSSQISIYQAEGSDVRVEVSVSKDTVWLSLNQMAELFGRDKSVVSRHIQRVFKSGELEKSSVVAKNATTAKDGKTYQVDFYNLDLIISVGYRVNSIQGTNFRIWATSKLKEYLVEGYSVNKSRLAELKQSIKLIQSTVASNELNKNQSAEIVNILSDYALGLDMLDGYDNQIAKVSSTTKQVSYKIEYNDAMTAIGQLKTKFGGSDLFGNEKDSSFKSSIAAIDQTFDGKELYTSLEEKAAHLLYFVVKNHSFTDGNKRIAAWLFVWYLHKNNFLLLSDGRKRIENNALASITLMVALSKPKEKELMIKIIVNSINEETNGE